MSTRGAPRLAVVGAASLIGAAVVEELIARRVPCAELHALDESRALGRAGATDSTGEQGGGPPLEDVARFDFGRIDLALFCGRSALSERYVESVSQHAWVIDGSSLLRERADVPLVVADLNGALLDGAPPSRLVALPGSASVALATALAPLDALAALARVEVVTLQAVSGSGRGAVDDLAAETAALLNGRPARGRAFGRQMAFNVIPQIDSFEADGRTRAERRLGEEVARVLGRPTLPINATAVRVPVFFGHSLVVHATFGRDLSVAAAIDAVQRGKGVFWVDPSSDAEFPTPATVAEAPDRVYVSRLRRDETRDRALNFWVVADNVRKCAAHNAVSIAQILVNRYL